MRYFVALCTCIFLVGTASPQKPRIVEWDWRDAEAPGDRYFKEVDDARKAKYQNRRVRATGVMSARPVRGKPPAGDVPMFLAHPVKRGDIELDAKIMLTFIGADEPEQKRIRKLAAEKARVTIVGDCIWDPTPKIVRAKIESP